MLRYLLLLTAGFVFLGLAMQACGQKPAPQESCNFVQNADYQRVSWGQNTPVTLYIDASLPPQYFPAVQAAADEWNNALGTTVIKVGGVSNRSGGQPVQNGFNTIYYMSTWDTPQTNEQARTTIYWSGTRIYEADVRINARDHVFFYGSQPDPGVLDMESLLVHEFGHVLGLAHTTMVGSVMVKSLAAADTADFVSRRSPSAFDQSSLRCEY
jgi:predicted Zn-dependent protease